MSAQIALTGATGFIGRRVLERLLTAGLQIRALSRRPNALPAHPRLVEIRGDLDERAAIERLVDGCDAAVHLAGAVAGRNFADFARVNAAGTARLVHALEQHNPGCRLILVSSLAAREPALSDYAASKLAGEEVVASSPLDWFILRPPAVYGPDDPALAPLWRMLAAGWLLRAGPARARFSLLHVDDLADAIDGLLHLPCLGRERHCLDDGRPGGWRWSDIAAAAERVGGRPVRIVPLPRLLLGAAGRMSQGWSRLRRTPAILSPGKARELTHIDWVCDSRLAEVLKDWSPQRDLESALPELPGWRR